MRNRESEWMFNSGKQYIKRMAELPWSPHYGYYAIASVICYAAAAIADALWEIAKAIRERKSDE